MAVPHSWVSGLACLVVAACSNHNIKTESPAPENHDSASVLLEPQTTLLGSGALGLTYFPDEGVSRLPSATGVKLVVTASVSTYLLEGPDLQHLNQATRIVAPGAAGEFDNGYAGVSAVVRVGQTFYGFYHAEDQQALPGLGGGIPGFYASIGVVTSEDGVNWQKRGAVITSSHSKEWQAYPNQGDRGAAEPGATLSADGRYVYLYYTEHSRAEGRSVDICVARADLEQGPPLPGSFSKYRNGAFAEPGLGGQDSPVIVGPNPAHANALEGHITYSKALGAYLMIFGVDAWEERAAGRPAALGGLYAAWSSDGITFSTPERLIADQGVPETGRSLSWEGTALFDDETTTSGTLIYGYTPSWGSTPHYMVARRFTAATNPLAKN